jgi:hypothetical protein
MRSLSPQLSSQNGCIKTARKEQDQKRGPTSVIEYLPWSLTVDACRGCALEPHRGRLQGMRIGASPWTPAGDAQMLLPLSPLFTCKCSSAAPHCPAWCQD